ncbi:MAG: DUF3575 domain-containing protein [Sphingobacteriaceae bacterium]|nr:MAG: DUF3575 domain-containing protein [Sphingobacteriaceae bacterium]
MKKLPVKVCLTVLFIAALGTLSNPASAQKIDTLTRNIIKLNVPALFLKNVSLQYERAIGKRTSVALGIRFAPKSNVPFKSKIKDLINNDNDVDQVDNLSNQIDRLTTGNFAITPEFRFYLGKKGVFNGFYLAPFARYATYSAQINPYEYTYEPDGEGPTVTRFVDLKGNINTITGGLMIGAQWKLSRQFSLDWWILGASAGSSSGTIKGVSAQPLTTEEQQALREDLKELDDIKLIKTETTVDANGARIKVDGPWYTLRAGLAIGYRF